MRGGVNPRACAAAVVEAAREAGVGGRARVALVTGDDLMDRLDALLAAGHRLAHMETGAPLTSVRDRVQSVNAYLGARPLVEAFRQSATVVVTGRCADAALTYGPLAHEFGWGWDDWDRLAAGVVAGHINECGGQASGGNSLPEWWTIPDLAGIGFPIVEAEESGEFVVTKHAGSGGRIDRRVVSEQIVYEIGDPARYVTPDVVADFTSVHLTDDGPDRVHVQGVRGRPAPEMLKGERRVRGWVEGGRYAHLRVAGRRRQGARGRAPPARAAGPGGRRARRVPRRAGRVGTRRSAISRASLPRTFLRCSCGSACGATTGTRSSASRARSRRSS